MIKGFFSGFAGLGQFRLLRVAERLKVAALL